MIKPYNTGNPVPSYDPRDLDDNAEILDKLITGTELVVPDRKGVPRKSWAAIQQGVDGALQPVLDAAARAELAAAISAASANQKPTIADGLAATQGSGPDDRFFSVPGEGNAFSIQYRNDNGVEVEIGRMVSAEALAEITRLVSSYEKNVPEESQLIVSDPEGGVLAELTNRRLTTVPFDLISGGAHDSLGDSEGAVSFYSDELLTIVGNLEILYTDLPGIYVVDLDGGILNDLSNPQDTAPTPPDPDDPFQDGLLFSSTIATSPNYESNIYVKGLLPRRSLADEVEATLSSTSTSAQSSGSVLRVDGSTFGDQAIFNLREKSEANSRRFMTLNLKSVPLQSGSPVVKVLMIGDSITNYAGAYILNQYLVGLGYVPQFIGTVIGAGPGEGANGTGGLLNEGRHGWQARDYVFSLNRKLVVPAGEEAAYLAMSKADKVKRNPFLRVSTPEDSADLVRNGHVFDAAFYQARFGLETPDIVVSSMGTNDALNIPSADAYASMLYSDRIMHSQILAAWPSVKILRTIPGTAIDDGRDALWTSTYTQVISALQQSARDLGSRVTVAPLWAMTNPEGGYGVPVAPPGVDGFIEGNWSDDIHPIGSSRYGYYQAMAPFIAAQKLNLI